MNSCTRPSTNRTRRSGFSLVEVLIAILVLAIGMLGLGAIFPAVIAEQRSAFEVIEGEIVAKAAEGLISSNREFVDFSLISSDFNRKDDVAGERYAYEWVVPAFGATYPSALGPNTWSTPVPGYVDAGGFAADFAGSESGMWSFNSNNSTSAIANTNRSLTQIPVSARLYPQPYSGKDPKYVWDLALRRQPGGDHLQAAIFVRRIDARLRVPRGFSLSDALTGAIPSGALLPVALTPTGQPVADDGVDPNIYAAVQVLSVEVHDEHLDWLVFPNGRGGFIDTSVGFAAKIGQKLLDNTGVVRTVVGLPTVDPSDPLSGQLGGSDRVVQIDPPFTSQNAGEGSTSDVASHSNDIDWDDERASWVRQVIFTPRTPVAIRLVTLEESP